MAAQGGAEHLVPVFRLRAQRRIRLGASGRRRHDTASGKQGIGLARRGGLRIIRAAGNGRHAAAEVGTARGGYEGGSALPRRAGKGYIAALATPTGVLPARSPDDDGA